MKNRKLYKIVIIFVLICATGCNSNRELEINQIKIGNKIVNLKHGDELIIDYWNDVEINFNEEEVNKKIGLYENIKIGDSINDIINKMDLIGGYAIVNSEVPNQTEDGTTDIINRKFENEKTFDFDFLDADIIIGYKKNDDEWTKINSDELEDFLDSHVVLNDNDIHDVIIYKIDINGLDDEDVAKNHVISIAINYY